LPHVDKGSELVKRVTGFVKSSNSSWDRDQNQRQLEEDVIRILLVTVGGKIRNVVNIYPLVVSLVLVERGNQGRGTSDWLETC
jgi:hypothetical protein